MYALFSTRPLERWNLAGEVAPGRAASFRQDAFAAEPALRISEGKRAAAGRYAPPRVSAVVSTVVCGNPEPRKISTSYVERQNLTMRMSMRRLTRLTNAFSKKLENLKAAVALHFAYYNFCRVHQSLRITPAMAAGVSNGIWGIGDLLPPENGV